MHNKDCTIKDKHCELSKATRQNCSNTLRLWQDEYKQITSSASYDDFKLKCRMSHILKHNITAYLNASVNIFYVSDLSSRTALNLVFYFGKVAGRFLLKMLKRTDRFDPVENRIVRGLARYPQNILAHMASAHHSGDRKIEDIDVFMTPDSFQRFMRSFLALPDLRYNIQLKFIYSGLANNDQQIHYHVKISILRQSEEQEEYRCAYMFDIVVVNDVDTAISNFDLTFCMLSATMKDKSDEKLRSIMASDPLFDMNDLVFDFVHPADVFNRSGQLTGMFVQEFLNGNATTRNRIHKYSERGFTIRMPTPTGSIALEPNSYHRLLRNRADLPKGVKVVRFISHCMMYDSNYINDTALHQAWFDLFGAYAEALPFFERLREFHETHPRWLQWNPGSLLPGYLNKELTAQDFVVTSRTNALFHT